MISLEEAARQITDYEALDEKTLKTKIRRLYDIANVLQSIGLIQKTHMSTNRKPAFGWVGIEGVYTAINEIKEILKSKKHQSRIAFFTEDLPVKSIQTKAGLKFESKVTFRDPLPKSIIYSTP